MRTGCDKCGAEPATIITSRKHLGLIVYGRTWRRQGLLCRQHAMQLLTGDLAFSLVLGWWGVLSLFINLAGVVEQIAAIGKARSLPQQAAAVRAGGSQRPGPEPDGPGSVPGW